MKLKVQGPFENDGGNPKAESSNSLAPVSESASRIRCSEMDAICGRQYDPEPLRKFERTLDEYLDRFCTSEVTKYAIDELRELGTYLLVKEFEAVPRIKFFLDRAKTSGVFDRMVEIMHAVGEDKPVEDRSLEELAMYHIFGKIFFGMAYADTLRPALAH